MRSQHLAMIAALLAMLGGRAQASDWTPIPYPDGDMQAGDTKHWRPYRGSKLEKIANAWQSRQVLRVTVTDRNYGGLRAQVTPRGGLGNRVRIELTYRVLAGGPVTVWAGPNTWNQSAGALASQEWESAVMELGLLSDFHLVLHLSQSGTGVFELADLKVLAQKGRRERVDVAIDSSSPSQPGTAFQVRGTPAPAMARAEEEGDSDSILHVKMPGKAQAQGRYLLQGLGQLPAGTRVTLAGRYRVAVNTDVSLGLMARGKPIAEEELSQTEWADYRVTHVLQSDGTPSWFVGQLGDEPAELWLASWHAWVELPSPTAPGVVPLGRERRPITFSATQKDAKSIYITPSWPEIRRFKCHLEYNSRWGFRSPTSHELKLSDDDRDLALTWTFEGDPVRYTVRMKSDRPDSALIEARITNNGNDAAEEFVPGFCLQISGAHAPKTFTHMIIPRQGRPFPLDSGHCFDTRPALWPFIGWVRAHYTESQLYAERLKQGESYKPDRPNRIRQAGDFPLLARRLPGRDAWIAWVWPNAPNGYFGNTQTPCMHMDPQIPACPPGESRSVFGRLIFFEGRWDELYETAQRERVELAGRASSR